MKIYVYIIAAIIALTGLSTLYYKGYSDGKQVISQRLQDDRITVLQDGKRIDNDVLVADDDTLFCLLVNCKSK